MKCIRDGCFKEEKNGKYCSRECAPFGLSLAEKKLPPLRSTDKSCESCGKKIMSRSKHALRRHCRKCAPTKGEYDVDSPQPVDCDLGFKKAQLVFDENEIAKRHKENEERLMRAMKKIKVVGNR